MTLAGVAGAALLIFCLAALAQALTGFGSALVAVPLLALVVAPVTAVVAATMVGLLLSSFAGYREREHVERRVAGRLVLAGVLGLPVGLLVLARVDERGLKALISVGLLVFVVLLAARVRLPTGSRTQYGVGVLSGALLTSTGMNGPPIVLALHGLQLPPRRFRATLQVVFAGQDLLAIVGFAVLGLLDLRVVVAVVAGAAGLPLGWWLGDRLFGLLSPERFRVLVLTMLAATAATSLLAAVG